MLVNSLERLASWSHFAITIIASTVCLGGESGYDFKGTPNWVN